MRILRNADGSSESFECYKMVRYVSIDLFTGRRRSNAGHIVGVSDAVSAVLPPINPADNYILECVRTGDRGLRLFAIVGVVKCDGDDVWATEKKMTEEGGMYRFTTSTVKVLMLYHGVRRVGLIHQPDCGCNFDRVQNVAKNSSDMLGGGAFHVFGREKGYSPNMRGIASAAHTISVVRCTNCSVDEQKYSSIYPNKYM